MFGFEIARTPDRRWWMVLSTATCHRVWSGYQVKKHWSAEQEGETR
jgi:hypothetical protein